jgi:hypothetical protein
LRQYGAIVVEPFDDVDVAVWDCRSRGHQGRAAPALGQLPQSPWRQGRIATSPAADKAAAPRAKQAERLRRRVRPELAPADCSIGSYVSR